MKVVEMTTNAFWKGESEIRGVIEDSGRQYQPRLYIKDGRIRDYSCSCSHGDSYRGMCSHCEALHEYFARHRDDNQRAVTTSQQARTMIREYTNREVARILREGEEKRVMLVPLLVLERRELSLEFKVGIDRFYMVRDLIAFSKAVESGTYVEYGKSLAFHHAPDAFKGECRPLVDFVVEMVNTYCEHYGQFQKSAYSAVPVLRRLQLMRSSRDRFFSLMMNRTLEVERSGGGKRGYTVTAKNPELTVEIRREGNGGVCVSIDKAVFCFFGERHLYLGGNGVLYRCDEECSSDLGVFIEQITGGPGMSGEMMVSNRDMPLFYERVLKKIAAHSVILSPELELERFKPEELKARFEFDSERANELTMKPTLSYGGFSFRPVEDDRVPRTICRDVPGEFRISQLITKYFQYKENETESLVIRDDEDGIYRLLTEGIGEFAAVGEVYLSDSFKRMKVISPPKVSVGVRGAGGWLELKVDTGDLSGEELLRILEGYSQKKKYYRLKNGEFLTLEDNGFLTVAKLMEGLALNQSDLQKEKVLIPRYRALYLDGILKEGRGITLYRDPDFKAVVRGMKSVEDSDFEIPPALANVLRPYQKNGFRWMKTLDYYGFGGILADDMGLGKTLQVITLLLEEAERGKNHPSLIVCPASLVYNWENEVHTFAPALKTRMVVGTAQEREARLKDWEDFDVLITSYDLLKRDVEAYRDKEFRYQIIDEAQYIKNASTQSAKAVKAVCAKTRFALTGTPIENRLGELWSIFDYLMPGFLFGYQKFKKEYELPVVKEGNEEALKNLHRMIGPFVLRRLKKEVLKELPDKLETVVYSRFEKEQGDLYRASAYALKTELERGGCSGDKLQVLAALMRLRQICCDPRLCYSDYGGGSAKLETCIDLVSNGVAGGHKILLFSQFTAMLEIIGKRLEREGLACYKLMGATPKEERLRMVNSFHEDEVPVFLISLKAGGTGLNLTAADIVIHYDPWWNVAAQNQATDRAHRIGQSKQVSVFKLITKDTIEENILKLQESKQDLAEQVIAEGAVFLSSLTKEDLLGLLE